MPKTETTLTTEQILKKALEFVADIAQEELPHAKVGTGAEVALRHIHRKATQALNDWSIGHGG